MKTSDLSSLVLEDNKSDAAVIDFVWINAKRKQEGKIKEENL